MIHAAVLDKTPVKIEAEISARPLDQESFTIKREWKPRRLGVGNLAMNAINRLDPERTDLTYAQRLGVTEKNFGTLELYEGALNTRMDLFSHDDKYPYFLRRKFELQLDYVLEAALVELHTKNRGNINGLSDMDLRIE